MAESYLLAKNSTQLFGQIFVKECQWCPSSPRPPLRITYQLGVTGMRIW